MWSTLTKNKEKTKLMLEVSVFEEKSKQKLTNDIRQRLKRPVFVCIGTEKVFSDSLGPRVGSMLNEQMQTPAFIYGVRSKNITAENLSCCYDFIKSLHPTEQIVVIDAAVGTPEQIGNVQVSNGGLVPGAATNKNLPPIGDVSIVGIVADKGMEDFYTLSAEKELLVNKVAAFIAESIVSAISQRG